MKMRTMAPYWKRWRLWRSARIRRSRRGRRRRPLRTRPCIRSRRQADQMVSIVVYLYAGRRWVSGWGTGAHGAGALAGEEPVEGHSGDDVEHHPLVHVMARDAPRVGDHLAVIHVRRAEAARAVASCQFDLKRSGEVRWVDIYVT